MGGGIITATLGKTGRADIFSLCEEGRGGGSELGREEHHHSSNWTGSTFMVLEEAKGKEGMLLVLPPEDGEILEEDLDVQLGEGLQHVLRHEVSLLRLPLVGHLLVQLH